jgi:hypothetical protein
VRTADWEREQARQRVAAHIVGAVPGVSLPRALAAMEAAKVRHIALHAVDRHIAEHPDALVAGDPASPVGLVRLAQTLYTAGFTTVRLIGCARCGTTDGELTSQSPTGRICRRCVRQTAEKKVCTRCGRTSRLEGWRQGRRVCGTCVANNPDTFADCAGCGRHARPCRRLPNGAALCQRCAPIKVYPCTVCGQVAPAAVQTATGPVCKRCYPDHQQPRRECSGCHRVRRVKVRATAEHGDLCPACAPVPVGVCTVCGHERPGHHRAGAFTCTTCSAAQRPARECALCRQSRLVNAEWPIGSVCAACYRNALRHPAPCVGCGRLRILTGVENTGSVPQLCGPCAGGQDYACLTCDTPGAAYERGRCARCVLATRLHTTFADADGAPRGQYAVLVTVLASTDQPESLLANWLKPHHPAVQLLTGLAREGKTVSHQLLDELPQTPQLQHLRRLLVFAAVIPPRDHEYLHRLGPWLRDQLDDHLEHHVRLVHPYAEWYVLHRARRKPRRRNDLGYSSAIYARANITAALDLLTWLDRHHTALDQLTQDQLERWIDEPVNQYKPIRGFIRWATKTRHARELIVPPRRRGPSSPILDEEQRWQQLRHCLHDSSTPQPVRVVGTLTLLFGLTTSRILELTTDDLTITPQPGHPHHRQQPHRATTPRRAPRPPPTPTRRQHRPQRARTHPLATTRTRRRPPDPSRPHVRTTDRRRHRRPPRPPRRPGRPRRSTTARSPRHPARRPHHHSHSLEPPRPTRLVRLSRRTAQRTSLRRADLPS